MATALVLASPGVARACSVCSAGRDGESQTAFILTTVFLTLLPLLGLGAAAWWLVRRARTLEGRAGPAPGASPRPAPGVVVEG
jgi:hypothetical protein